MWLVQVWEVEEGKHSPGNVLHTIGWPLDRNTYGGSFLYHMKDRQVTYCCSASLMSFLSLVKPLQLFKGHFLGISIFHFLKARFPNVSISAGPSCTVSGLTILGISYIGNIAKVGNIGQTVHSVLCMGTSKSDAIYVIHISINQYLKPCLKVLIFSSDLESS